MQQRLTSRANNTNKYDVCSLSFSTCFVNTHIAFDCFAFVRSLFRVHAFATQETRAMKKDIIRLHVPVHLPRYFSSLCSSLSLKQCTDGGEEEKEKAVPLYAFSKIDVVLMTFVVNEQ